MAIRRSTALLIVTVGLSVPVGASAAPDSGTHGAPVRARPPLAESLNGSAKDDYEAGKLLFSDGDYAGAALKFERAHAASKDPRLLWNQAAAEKNLRRHARAEALLLRYLKEAGELSSDAERAEATALLQAIQGFVAEVRLTVSQPGAQVFVDDVSVGSSPLPASLRVDAGKRRIRVTKPGFRDAVEELELAGREVRSISLVLEPASRLGRLRVITSGGATIRVDGKVVGIGQWEGAVSPGSHQVEVVERGKRPHGELTEVRGGDLTSLQITLQSAAPAPREPEREQGGGVPAWVWVAGGVALTAIAVGSYFLLESGEETPPPPARGSLGTLNLPLGF